MARLQLTEDLLAELRLRAAVPNTQASGSTDDDLLGYLNDELLYNVVPQIMNTREEFFVVTEEIVLVASKTKYRMPERAIGNKLRKTFWVDQAGAPTIRDDLTCIGADDVADYEASNRITRPQAYYIEGNHMVLIPNIATNPVGAIEASYYFRPGAMVQSPRYAVVDTVVDANNLTVVALPTSGVFATGLECDIHSGKSGAEPRSWDNEITNIVANTITFQNTIDGTASGNHAVEEGDYVCVANEAAAPMGIPVELAPIIVQSAAVRYAENKGVPEEVEMHRRTLDRHMHRISQMLNMRVEGQPKKIKNPVSLWRSNRRRWRR